MQRLLKRFIRTSAFLGKEISEVRRQPRLVLSLILGPFLILLIFGTGYVGQSGRLSAIIVVPVEGGYSRDVGDYQKMVGSQLDIRGVTTDEAAAIDRLNRRDVDIVVVVPKDAAQQIASGAQAKLPVYYNEVDPLRRDYINYLTYLYTNEINKQTVAAAAGQGQESAGDVRTTIQRMRVRPGSSASPRRGPRRACPGGATATTAGRTPRFRPTDWASISAISAVCWTASAYTPASTAISARAASTPVSTLT